MSNKNVDIILFVLEESIVNSQRTKLYYDCRRYIRFIIGLRFGTFVTIGDTWV